MFVTERLFSVNGYQLAAKEWHVGAPQKVIACHGWLDNAASFDVLAALMPDCHLLALDMPGHGRSDHKSLQATYNLWDDLSDILAIADDMGWQTFNVLGHSRGAMMSLLLAAAMPDRVKSVAMLDAVWPVPVAIKDTTSQLRQFLLDNQKAKTKRLPSYASIEAAIDARCNVTGMSEHAARLIIERGTVLKSGRYCWSCDPRLTMASSVKLSELHNQALVESLTMPTLVILANQGLGKNQTLVEQLSVYSHMDVRSVSGGHHCHMEAAAPILATWCEDLFSQSF